MSGLNFPSDCDGDPETDPTAVINYESELSLLLDSPRILHGLERVQDGPECCYEDGAKDDDPIRGGSGAGGHKRIRSTQLHNLNERLRRQKLKEKMKALQELVPNCNKRDKSSTLDDAINYIKTLQYQLQMMSTGAGYTMFNSPMISQSDPGPMIGTGRACSSSLFGYPTSPLGPSISQLHIPTSFSLSLPLAIESQGIPNQSCTINEQCIKGGSTARVLPSQIILPDVEDYGSSHLSSTTWPTSSGT